MTICRVLDQLQTDEWNLILTVLKRLRPKDAEEVQPVKTGLTTATISAAFPLGQRMIGTAPGQQRQLIIQNTSKIQTYEHIIQQVTHASSLKYRKKLRYFAEK